ncbi:MAG TPA: 4Fe-4S binding protein [Bacillota bacterium]|nr:4Fe-4S binding protein [Bacillota bacterium]
MKTFKEAIHKFAWFFLPGFLVAAWFYQVAGILALVCMLAPVVVAFFKGRIWCGFFCPRGSFNDTLLAQWSRKRPFPGFFTAAWFRSTFLVVLMSAFAIQIALAWGNLAAVGMVFWRMIVITTLITVLLGTFYHQRSWCRICPMGTLAGYVANLRSFRKRIQQVRFQKEKCIDCKICTKSCPVAINVHGFKEFGQVSDSDCLKCRACIAQCPKQALQLD